MVNIQHRDPNQVMTLSRLGSFHQSKLSFLRSFIREFKGWDFKQDVFDLDHNGYGKVIYSVRNKDRVYSLICFANELESNERSDRVHSYGFKHDDHRSTVMFSDHSPYSP